MPSALEGILSFFCGKTFIGQPVDNGVIDWAGKRTVLIYRIRANVVREAGRILVYSFLACVSGSPTCTEGCQR